MNKASYFDFRSELRDPQKFLNDRLGSALANYEYDQISDYTDTELRQQVIQELLSVTMWEVQTGDTLVFLCESLLRFIPRGEFQGLRILEALAHPEVQQYIVIEGDQIRVKRERKVLQDAMDYCGIYYSGFEMPDGCIIVNREVTEQLLKETGSIENLAISMSMDLQATVEGTKTKQ